MDAPQNGNSIQLWLVVVVGIVCLAVGAVVGVLGQKVSKKKETNECLPLWKAFTFYSEKRSVVSTPMLTPTHIRFQDLEPVRIFDISTEIYEKHVFIDEKVISLGLAFTHNPEVVGSSPASATIISGRTIGSYLSRKRVVRPFFACMVYNCDLVFSLESAKILADNTRRDVCTILLSQM